eukprot:TRINITY_DN17981_c0_g1_i1.p1 TRINITY_DN17981_c0_g1~~TRINITY_DN17981_c0_g1_i1.p1  ORF type:complete len:366 (+),score=98.75 TRINITY_DN17981_c0_g1_i1:152-1249(+)
MAARVDAFREGGIDDIAEEDAVDEKTPLIGGMQEKTKTRIGFLVHVILPPLVLYIVGIIFLMCWEKWHFVTANYVIAQIVTTVGYGDFTVESNAAKLFMAFYAICVLVILAYNYNMFIGRLIDNNCDQLRMYLRRMERNHAGEELTDAEAAKVYGALNKLLATGFTFLVFVLFGTIFFRLFEHCTCQVHDRILRGCSQEDYDRCVATGGQTKEWADALYMSVVTLTTIGFGDVYPHTTTGKILGSIWMLLGVVCTASFLGSFVAWMFETEKRRKFTQVDALRGISQSTFQKIDRDGNGALSRGEFLAFTLVRYGMVDEDLVDEIHAQFDTLDVDGKNRVTLDRILARQRDLKMKVRAAGSLPAGP